MRDPDLVSRAQRAATALERAWDHWRTSHGLDAEPPPPVSSYVGYSLEEPWGQPRVVFGIAAEEAEQLATFLDRHRPAGAGQPGNGQLSPAGSSRLSPAVTGRTSQAGDGRLSPDGHGPANGMLSAAANGLSARDSVPGGRNGDGPVPARLAGDGVAPGRSATEGPAPGPAAIGTETGTADETGTGTAPADRTAAATGTGTAAASGTAAANGTAATNGTAAASGTAVANGTAADGKSLWRPRSHRHAGEHAAQRPGRQHGPAAAEDGALPPAGPPPRDRPSPDRPSPGQDNAGEGADLGGLGPVAGDLAGWASGELPGQASRGTAPWTFLAHPGLDHAEPSNGETHGGSAP
ncbi:MAG: hypothetical protein ABSA03_08410 [Streptosporangiaceae bacterium]|jgi:hypothetical protein